MSKIAESKARKEYYATLMEENAFISGYNKAAKDTIARIRKRVEKRYNDNIKTEEFTQTGYFGVAAKEDYELLYLLDELEKEYK